MTRKTEAKKKQNKTKEETHHKVKEAAETAATPDSASTARNTAPLGIDMPQSPNEKKITKDP